jgi:hypothetical protein
MTPIKSSIGCLALAVVILVSVADAQYWKSNNNNKMVKQWQEMEAQGLEKFPAVNNQAEKTKTAETADKKASIDQQQGSNSKTGGVQKSFAVAGQPIVASPAFGSSFQPQAAAVVQRGPFAIQQPAIGATGEIIIENLVGGIPYNCIGRPSGHYRDNRFADIFHACVHGSQRKTYACPIVGERTYFDEVTRRCEFVNRNPNCCVNVSFYH